MNFKNEQYQPKLLLFNHYLNFFIPEYRLISKNPNNTHLQYPYIEPIKIKNQGITRKLRS